MRSLILVLAVASLAAACGDNIRPGPGDDVDASPIDAAVPDAEVPDAMVCPAQEPGLVGGPCTANADCDSAAGAGDGVCYLGTSDGTTFAPEGFCTREDMVDFVYCTEDAECGSGGICVDNEGYVFCLPACDCAGDACPANQACFDSFNGYALDKPACVPGNRDAADGDACDGFYECNKNSNCRNDSLEFPGGMCAGFGCTIGDDTTCHGGHCVDGSRFEAPFVLNMCVDTCTSDTECRQAEGYVCFDPDGAGSEKAFCRRPHVGDPCTADADCGSAAIWTCQTDGFPGGYCTVTGCTTPGTNNECSPGSICHDPLVGDNYCADRCPRGEIGMQSNCRTGYLCVDTDPGLPLQGGCVPTPL